MNAQSQIQILDSLELTYLEEQRENLASLRQVIEDSIDNFPTEDEIQTAIATFSDIISDQTITSEELEQIASGITSAVDDLGLTAYEIHGIILAAQDIVVDSRLPQTSEEVVGTSGNDLLLGQGGDDVLVGTDTKGEGEIDGLIGGAGQDEFVLGSESAVFYDDDASLTMGVGDFALIIDFNVADDLIQLSGSADDYSLSSVPDSLSEMFPNLDGTAIYRQGSDDVSQDELIGIVYGYDVTDLSSGFEFV